MDFELSEESKMFQRLSRDFTQKECLPVEKELLDKDPDFIELPKDIFIHLRNKVKEIGLWALDVPEEYGGQNISTLNYCVINEQQAWSLIGTLHRSPLWTWPAVRILPSLYRSSDYQKEKYLYPQIRGEKLHALAYSEPDAGSDAASIKTTAVKDGDYWVINGTKLWCSGGDWCDFVYCTAVTDKKKGHHGITLFIIDKETPGFEVTRIIQVMRTDPTTEVLLDNCRIHDRQRIEGSGWVNFQEGMDKWRLLMGARCVGQCSRAIDMAINYAMERVTFGEPLSNRQMVQAMLADSAIDIQLTRLLVHRNACLRDQGIDVRQETFMTKLFASEMGNRVLDKCIEILGAIGVTRNLPLERWWRDIRISRIGEGPSEVMRWAIARNLFKGWRP